MDGFCQAYHWTLPDVLKLTVPQIIMMNHAAWVNGKNRDIRIERDRAKDASNHVEEKEKQQLEEMDGAELSRYLRNIGNV